MTCSQPSQGLKHLRRLEAGIAERSNQEDITMDECFSEIEDSRFAAMLGLASGLQLFVRICADQPVVGRLIDLADDLNAWPEVEARAEKLIQAPHLEPQYERLGDGALACYLLCLSTRVPTTARELAALVAESQGWWWARHMARLLLEREPAAT